MCEYRLYFFDENDHICASRPILAASDADALAEARADSDRPAKSELWLQDQRVAVLNAR